jgi:hypothetical protein
LCDTAACSFDGGDCAAPFYANEAGAAEALRVQTPSDW